MPSPAEPRRAARRALLLLLGLSAVAQASGSGETTPGTVLPQAPTAPPGAVSDWPADRLAEARLRWSQGDAAGTATLLEPWLALRRGGPSGRTRTSAHLLAGMAQQRLGNHNLASAHFHQVRRSGGPLAPYGAWQEAVVDLERGRYLVAARECSAYRSQWPEGIHADECLLLMGAAYGAAGSRSASWAAYGEYLKDHPETPREEEIQLARAQATAVVDPAGARLMALDLWRDHSYPSTDLAVTALLAELQQAGVDTTLPTDSRSQMQRCASLRRSGRFDEAWALFQALSAQAPTSPEIADWVADNEERYAWSTRNYDLYGQRLLQQYQEKPDPELAWNIYRAYARQGAWDKAADWGRQSVAAHKGHWRWRSVDDQLAQAEMLSGDYAAAADRFAAMRGADPEFYAAFCTYMAEKTLKAPQAEPAPEGAAAQKPPDAEALLSAIAERSGAWQAAALYWRGQLRLRDPDRADAARADLQAAAELDRTGWYALLQQTPPPPGGEDWLRRDGRWHGPAPLVPPTLSAARAEARPADGLLPAAQPVVSVSGKTRRGLTPPPADPVDWDSLRWPLAAPAAEAAPSAAVSVVLPPAPATIGSLPTGYTACLWFDPRQAARTLYATASKHGTRYKDLWTAYDLMEAGQYGEAARLIGPLFEDWREAPGAPRLSAGEWRDIFLAVQAHHYAARYCSGMDRGAPDAEAARAAGRLAYPVVRPPELWRHSQAFNLDPFLLMGIMRQESTYQEFVVSHAGAIGLIQVMPSTGARVAALMGEHTYSPGDLEDPSINIRYGAFYLSRLLDRFGDSYPLAVASYNGGPHNVSRWMTQIHDDVTLAEYVEHIPWGETRDYVKRVSGHYARYVDLYAPQGAGLAVPAALGKDDASIIDF